MNPVKNKNIREAIVLIQKLDDGSLVVVDAKTTIRYLNIETLELLNGFKANINHLRYKTKVIAFSNNGKYFSSLTTDCKEARVYNTTTKSAVAKVSRHHGEVSCVGIDPNSRYMFSCGDDGKTFAVDINSGKLAFTLPVHVDTVNDIVFSKNGNWIATSSYDRKVSIFNLSMMTPKHKLKGHSSPVMKVRFLNKHRIFSVDKTSSAIIWDIYSGKVISRLQGIHDDVTQVVTDGEDKFLFIGTALGYVLVYDLNSYELLSKKYIKLKSSITAMEFDSIKNNLIIGKQEGDLLFYNIYEGEDKLKEFLKSKEFEEIQRQADVNPLLAYTKIFDLVSNL